MATNDDNKKIGDPVKVYLKGESPWAIYLGMTPTGSMIGRLDNYLVAGDLHGYQMGDVLEFRRVEYMMGGNPVYCWEPVGRYQGPREVEDARAQ